MKENTILKIRQFFKKYKAMDYLETSFNKAIEEIALRIKAGGKMLLCGNGGSASDCDHIAGELLKNFYIKRDIDKIFKEKIINDYPEGKSIAMHLQGSISAISLMSHNGFLSAFSNDCNSDFSLAQLVYGYGNENDILIAISTSGNAKNINYALCVAKCKNLLTIGLTGNNDGNMKDKCDIIFNVPQEETYLVQELHLPLYHMLCMAIEYEIFGE